MAAYVNDSAMDSALTWVVLQGTRLNICDTVPTSYAEATSTYMLAQSASALTSTNFTIAPGAVDGRKVTIPATSALSVATSGTSHYVALTGSSDSTLLLYAPCTSQALVTGNTVSTTAFDWTIRDATT